MNGEKHLEDELYGEVNSTGNISPTKPNIPRDQEIHATAAASFSQGAPTQTSFRRNHEFLTLQDPSFIKDVDCSSTSSSSSSGVVSSSTAGRDYYEIDSFNNADCLAYRAPWATPPTATLESHRLPSSGISVTSPSGSSVSSYKSHQLNNQSVPKIRRGTDFHELPQSPPQNDAQSLEFRESRPFCEETVRLGLPGSFLNRGYH